MRHWGCSNGLGWIGRHWLQPQVASYADYTLDAANSETIAFISHSYRSERPRQWDSGNGQYGGGSANVGAEGSQLPLEGSVDDFNLNTRYIPIEDWGTDDYGCYEFTVSVTQNSPWSDGTAVTYTSFYDYEEQGGDQEMTPTILIHGTQRKHGL